MSRDLYKLLGVDKGASDAEIRKAYKKLARKHHPDVNPGNTVAEERFKEISAAYEVLNDTKKRAAYDEFGEEALRSGFDANQARSYQQWQSGRNEAEMPFSDEGVEFDLGDLFSRFSRTERGPFAQRGAQAPTDVHAVAELDFEQAIRGTEVNIEVPTSSACGECKGSGHAPNTEVARCGTCSGSGRQHVAQGPMKFVKPCSDCGGTGERSTPCARCRGTGRTPSTDRVRVRIPPGADNGSSVRIAGKGAGAEGQRGDLVIETRVKPHAWLNRDGLDLRMKLPVTIGEAYGGAKVDVPTFDGMVSLTVPARSQSGQTLRLRGKGVKRGKSSGDLYVELSIRVPDVEDEQLAEVLQGAASSYREPIRGDLAL